MPIPLSQTETSNFPFSFFAKTEICPPSGVYFMEFPIIFQHLPQTVPVGLNQRQIFPISQVSVCSCRAASPLMASVMLEIRAQGRKFVVPVGTAVVQLGKG